MKTMKFKLWMCLCMMAGAFAGVSFGAPGDGEIDPSRKEYELSNGYGDRLPVEELERVLRVYPGLEALTLHGLNVEREHAEVLGSCNLPVKALWLQSIWGTEGYYDSYDFLIDLLGSEFGKRLEFIAFDLSDFFGIWGQGEDGFSEGDEYKDKAQRLAECLREMQALKHVRIRFSSYYPSYCRERGMLVLELLLEGLPHIESLDISENSLHLKDAERLRNAIANIRNLKELYLRDHYLVKYLDDGKDKGRGVDLGPLAQILEPHVEHLEVLDVSRSNLQLSDPEAIIELFSRFRKLKELILGNEPEPNLFLTEHLEVLMKGFRDLPDLECLLFSTATSDTVEEDQAILKSLDVEFGNNPPKYWRTWRKSMIFNMECRQKREEGLPHEEYMKWSTARLADLELE